MSFFTADKSLNANKDGSDFLTEGGIYPMTIDFVAVNVNKEGARQLDFHMEYNGSKLWLYGLKLDTNSLEEHFQRRIFNKLLNILGIDSVADPVKANKKAWVASEGKDSMKEYLILPELQGKKVYVRIRKEFSLYLGELKEKNIIESFFRISDKASASEVLSGKDIGTQFEKELAIAKNPTMRDNLTMEDVKALKEAKRTGKKATVSNAAQAEEDDKAVF